MADRSKGRNVALSRLLAEAGLTPRALARELNRIFGAGTTAETAPYHWRDASSVPRKPLPAFTAYVMSRALGRVVTIADLWPGHTEAADGTMVVPASTAMTGPWSPAMTMQIADEWLLGGLVDRRTFLNVSGAALTRAVSTYLTGSALQDPAPYPPLDVDDPLVDQIEASVPRLQLLDDERGGGTGLSYVGAQVKAALLVLRESAHTEATQRRLLVALADLAQLAGWKAHDAAMPGLAQRYLFTGLRAAHDAGYRPMEAHILADLSFHSASLGDTRDGVVLGEAARQAAQRSTPSVQASVQSRLAYAYAAAGNIAETESAWLVARDALERRQSDHDPHWMYYLTRNHLDCQAGYSLISAGRQLAASSPREGRAVARKGEALLRTGVYARPLGHPYQRRALYEGAWLALGYTVQGKLDDACAVARLALPRLENVRSPRSTALLNTLAKELVRRKRNPTVADFLPELDAALGGQAA